MRYRFDTIDVFTDRRFGGNPLAVLPDARGLDSATMEQGFEMGRPGILDIEVECGPDGSPTAVHVGGASVLVTEGVIEI